MPICRLKHNISIDIHPPVSLNSRALAFPYPSHCFMLEAQSVPLPDIHKILNNFGKLHLPALYCKTQLPPNCALRLVPNLPPLASYLWCPALCYVSFPSWVRAGGICPSLSALFHWSNALHVRPFCCKWQDFILYSDWANTHLHISYVPFICIMCVSFVHSPINKHFDYGEWCCSEYWSASDSLKYWFQGRY